MFPLLYSISSIGGILGSVYGFGYGIESVKNDLYKNLKIKNKSTRTNELILYGSTLIYNPNKIIFHIGTGFLLGVIWPIPLAIAVKKYNTKSNQSD
jgi:hypothetical protein